MSTAPIAYSPHEHSGCGGVCEGSRRQTANVSPALQTALSFGSPGFSIAFAGDSKRRGITQYRHRVRLAIVLCCVSLIPQPPIVRAWWPTRTVSTEAFVLSQVAAERFVRGVDRRLYPVDIVVGIVVQPPHAWPPLIAYTPRVPGRR